MAPSTASSIVIGSSTQDIVVVAPEIAMRPHAHLDQGIAWLAAAGARLPSPAQAEHLPVGNALRAR